MQISMGDVTPNCPSQSSWERSAIVSKQNSSGFSINQNPFQFFSFYFLNLSCSASSYLSFLLLDTLVILKAAVILYKHGNNASAPHAYNFEQTLTREDDICGSVVIQKS